SQEFKAPLVVEDSEFPGMRHLQRHFTLHDEIYQIKDFSRVNVRVLLRLDAGEVEKLGARGYLPQAQCTNLLARIWGFQSCGDWPPCCRHQKCIWMGFAAWDRCRRQPSAPAARMWCRAIKTFRATRRTRRRCNRR